MSAHRFDSREEARVNGTIMDEIQRCGKCGTPA